MHLRNRNPRVCLVPNVSGIGGMVSFRGRLTSGLAGRGIDISTSLDDTPYDAILVIGGTRQLAGLRSAKRRGIRIVQRLDGMNWIHRRRRTGLRHYLRAEYGNFILSTIRSRLADHIVYQSRFSQTWWERVYGVTRISSSVVYNAVDLSLYSPAGPADLPTDLTRILLVEGAIGGGYEWGLETAVTMAQHLSAIWSKNIQLMVAGRVSSSLQQQFPGNDYVQVTFAGQVPADQIPQLDRSAHVLYAADLNAACPNSVIEALACGLPVAAFDTGALSELVTPSAGRVVPYGGDPWKLDPPDIASLAAAVVEILEDLPSFRAGARQRAEATFGLDHMVSGYMEALKL